ncbi:MAG: hypothetical protein AB4911_10750 [Oscillochloridaceae bacterium umkhey_bin13]
MLEFFWRVWQAITYAMRLDPAVAEYVERNLANGDTDAGRGIALTVAILGGAGLLIGQSVILFVNRVRPERFVLSLLLNGVVFAISLLIWGVFIWLIGMVVFPQQPPIGLILRLIALSAAPYVFGFLILIPYLGEGIYRLLSAWSMLIAAGATAFSFRVGWWQAFAVVGVSWLLIWVMSNTIAKPVLKLRNRAWQLVAGSRLDASVSDILTQFSLDQREGNAQEGKKP